jgi:hypothetical protein
VNAHDERADDAGQSRPRHKSMSKLTPTTNVNVNRIWTNQGIVAQPNRHRRSLSASAMSVLA